MNHALSTLAILFCGVLPVFSCGCSNDKQEFQASNETAEPGSQQDEPSSETEVEIDAGLTDSEYFNLARLAMMQNEYPRAVKLAEKAVETKPAFDTYLLTLADARFMNGEIAQAIEAYDALIETSPTSKPYLWQRGLALYYANQYAEGKAQFEVHQTVNNRDVENAIWHLLCAAEVEGLESARESLINIIGDRREWSREVYDLFAGKITPAQMTLPLPPADGLNRGELANRYYANLYLGLFYEMTDQPDKCLEHMQYAADGCPYGGDQLMGQIAAIHLKLRKD